MGPKLNHQLLRQPLKHPIFNVDALDNLTLPAFLVLYDIIQDGNEIFHHHFVLALLEDEAQDQGIGRDLLAGFRLLARVRWTGGVIEVFVVSLVLHNNRY
jgi:hypothetical protein